MDRYAVRKLVEDCFQSGGKYKLSKTLSASEMSHLIDVLWEYMEAAEETFVYKRELEELNKKIKALNNKSGQRVRCVKALPNRRALVQLGPIKEEVMVSPDVDMTKLKTGVEVLVIGGGDGRMLAGIRDHDIYDGRLSRIQRIIDDERVVIDDGGHELILKKADWISCKEGDEVRYDLESQMVLEVLGARENSAYSLSEVPDVTFEDVKGLEEEKKYLQERLIYPTVYKEKFQKYGLKPLRAALFHGPPGNGKAQPLDSLVLTPHGFVKMENIKKGSFVSTPDGEHAKVLDVFPQGEKDIYKVCFSDGSSAECCEEHLWSVKTSLDRQYDRSYKVRSLKDMKSDIFYGKYKKKNYSIPITNPVKFNEIALPIDPYLLGVLLGDGSFTNYRIRIANTDKELLSKVEKILNGIGYTLRSNGKASYNITNNENKYKNPSHIKKINSNGELLEVYCGLKEIPTHFSVPSIYKCAKLNKKYKNCFWEIIKPNYKCPNIINNILKDLKLYGCGAENKYIPEIYKISSINNRIKLLQGLIDTDGCVDGNGTVTFTSISKRLIEDLKFLVESLGGITTLRKPTNSSYKKNNIKIETGQTAYTLCIRLNNDIIPCSISRKVKRLKHIKKYSPSRYISDIRYIGKKQAQCILIDHPDHLYITNNFIVTHNTMLAGAIFNEMASLRTKQNPTLKEKISTSGFFVINGPSVLSKWAGNTEQTIREIFSEARKASINSGFTSIIFWDEIDSIAGKRKDVATYTPEKTVVPTLLSEIQGLNNGDGEVVLLCATNMPAILDPALMRPGRLGDLILEIPRPNKEACIEILKSKFHNCPQSLQKLIDGGLIEKLVSHVYDNETPLAVATLKSGKKLPLMRQEQASGALFTQIGEELVRNTCISEIQGAEAITIEGALELIENIMLNQIGVLDAGVKSGFTFNTEDYVLDVSLSA